MCMNFQASEVTRETVTCLKNVLVLVVSAAMSRVKKAVLGVRYQAVMAESWQFL